MIITCKACNTSFNLDDKMLKPTGSKVRCSICTTVFTAFPQQTPVPETPAKTVAVPDPDPTVSIFTPPAGPDSAEPGDFTSLPDPETDILAEASGALFSEDADLDFALDDEPEAGVSATGIEDALSSVLDDAPADFAFDSDSDFDSADADESGATTIASLDDDQLDLGPTPESAGEDATETVIANLDDDKLDFSFDEQLREEATGIADLDLEDLDLDVSLPTGTDSEANATVIANLDDDALDLDSDLSLGAEGTTGSVDSAEDDLPETLDDIDDLNLTLDMETGLDESQADAVPPKTADASLDDLSLDFDLDTDADMAEAASPAEAGAGPDDEFDLDLDNDGDVEGAPAVESAAFEDDLDLSSLESLLKDDETIGGGSAPVAVDEDQELTLDMDDETPMPEAEAAGEPGETLEDLDFNLDAEAKAASPDFDLSDDADQEIDLSEIEKMLEEPETGSAKFSSVPEQDLDLDIEASLETEKWMSESRDDNQLVTDEELDLSELEQVLEDVDTEATDDVLEDPDLELDLGDGEALGKSTETVAVDNRLDFDLSDFEDAAPDKTGADASARESVDMKLEFEMEEGGHSEKTLEDEGLEATVVVPEPKAEKGRKARPQSAAPPKPSPKPRPVKKGINKSLVFLLIIAIFGLGGYGTYFLLKQKGIEIPFLSEYLQPTVQDPGNLKLTTFDVNSKFVDNSSVGKLFVISGKVKNGYTESRGMITMTGQIFSTGKVPVHQETVYCGNVMSDLELANLEWEKIEARLSNRLGDNRSNVKVEPGTSIPFMVVFSGLPDDLEEFTIEVTGSTPLK
ncbi:DUF3426 domain-containing protein [Desulfosarcina sp.]|uniref:DUF3426 domain-containing protein n=1 Tax=Desulfosarcina sp. TaxID=2027861 RepID=UPI0039705132